MADGTARRMTVYKDKDSGARLDRPERIVSAASYDDDVRLDASVRPKTLNEYIGQKRVKENISIALEAARVLFGLKTNLGQRVPEIVLGDSHAGDGHKKKNKESHAVQNKVNVLIYENQRPFENELVFTIV